MTVNNSPSLTPTINNVSCNGGNNGSINLSVSGGNSPYTYHWVATNSSCASSNNCLSLMGAGAYCQGGPGSG